jgi:DNA-binding MarR family transcriptional regulator
MYEFIGLMIRASKLMRAAADEAMSEHGVRVGQNIILEVLWETDGLTPGELADRMHLTTPTIVNTARRMEAAGLLTRRRDPRDARLVRLYLTDRARAAQQPVREARERLGERVTALLTEPELRHLTSALRKIIEEFGGDA